MTPEKREETLKNSIVLMVQKQDDWSIPVQEAIKEELGKVINLWLKATETEKIGPKEAVMYLDRLWLRICEEPFLEKVSVTE